MSRPPLHVLLIEDDPSDAVLISRTVQQRLPDATIARVDTSQGLLEHLESGPVDLVISDSTVSGCEGLKGFHLVRARNPTTPFIYFSGGIDARSDTAGLQALGVNALVDKHDSTSLGPAIDAAMRREASMSQPGSEASYHRLVQAVTALSAAHDLPALTAVVRRAARELVGADGATFVLRDGEMCFYADEDAIGPLWKGQRFPLHTCLSGWSMLNRQPAVVPDIFTDARIPLAAYEPTFVRSVVIVPIRALDPIGAIGTYWSEKRAPAPAEVRLLQALADTTAVALENIRAYSNLEERVRERTAELEAFTYAVSHDLRAPVRHVQGFAQLILEDYGQSLDGELGSQLKRISAAADRMRNMIDALLGLTRVASADVKRAPADLAEIARELVDEIRPSTDRHVDFICPASLPVLCDPVLVRNVLQNLLANAWKFTATERAPRIELGCQAGPTPTYFVRDNGVGFDSASASRLFGVFQRLHHASEFPGTGVGLATVRRIIQKHGGQVSAQSQPNQGATFYFTLEPAAAA